MVAYAQALAKLTLALMNFGYLYQMEDTLCTKFSTVTQHYTENIGS